MCVLAVLLFLVLLPYMLFMLCGFNKLCIFFPSIFVLCSHNAWSVHIKNTYYSGKMYFCIICLSLTVWWYICALSSMEIKLKWISLKVNLTVLHTVHIALSTIEVYLIIFFKNWSENVKSPKSNTICHNKGAQL